MHFCISTSAFPLEWKHVAAVVQVQITKITSLSALGGKDQQDFFVLPLLCCDCAQIHSFMIAVSKCWCQASMGRKAYSPSVSHIGCSLPTGSKWQQVTSVLPPFVWEQSLDIFIIGDGILILMLACRECKKVLYQGKKSMSPSVLGPCYRMFIVGKCWRTISVLSSLV